MPILLLNSYISRRSHDIYQYADTTPSCFASSATLIGSSLGGSSLGGSLGAKLRGSSTWPLIWFDVEREVRSQQERLIKVDSREKWKINLNYDCSDFFNVGHTREKYPCT